MTALEVLDATIAVDVEVVSTVWRIHEALTTARRQHPEVDETLRPRDEERYRELLDIGESAREGRRAASGDRRVGTFADIYWGLMNVGTYRNLVVERGWSLDDYGRWVRSDDPAPDRRPCGAQVSRRCRRRPRGVRRAGR